MSVVANWVEQGLSRRDFLKQSGALGLGLGLSSLLSFPGLAAACGMDTSSKAKNSSEIPLLSPLGVQDFSGLKDRVSKITWPQLCQHIGLYEGYVKKTNDALTQLATARTTSDYSTARTLQLNHSFARNGAILHAAYFNNLGEDQPTIGPLTAKLIARDFGSEAAFWGELMAIAKAMRGWVIVGYSTAENRLVHHGLDAHDGGSPLASIPLLVLDVYEHAYMIDFGTNRAGYLDVFKASIRWGVVEDRLKQALAVANTLNHHPVV
ncbi:MAG: Fe-Mn family superoxide dismutase [Vampirovibrionales bacterium]|nr:Fe-Mn family superoxide dismutase [Vampirovibrionales bacterium]